MPHTHAGAQVRAPTWLDKRSACRDKAHLGELKYYYKATGEADKTVGTTIGHPRAVTDHPYLKSLKNAEDFSSALIISLTFATGKDTTAPQGRYHHRQGR